jgi:hypothetical protein
MRSTKVMSRKSTIKKVYTSRVVWVKSERRIGYVHLGSRTSGRDIATMNLVLAPEGQDPDKSIFNGALRMTLAQARAMKAFVKKTCPRGKVQIRKRFRWV